MQNGKLFLQRMKDSVEAQTLKDYELIIEWDRKMAENMNVGIKKAKGEIIKLLCMDDYLASPTSLQDIVDNWKGGWMATACVHQCVEPATYIKGAKKGQLVDAEELFDEHHPKQNDRVRLMMGENTIGGLSVVAFQNDDPPLFDENLSWLVDTELYGRFIDKWGEPTLLQSINVVIGIGSHQTTQIMSFEEKKAEFNYVKEKYKKIYPFDGDYTR